MQSHVQAFSKNVLNSNSTSGAQAQSAYAAYADTANVLAHRPCLKETVSISICVCVGLYSTIF